MQAEVFSTLLKNLNLPLTQSLRALRLPLCASSEKNGSRWRRKVKTKGAKG
jgi:hypothetical protein